MGASPIKVAVTERTLRIRETGLIHMILMMMVMTLVEVLGKLLQAAMKNNPNRTRKMTGAEIFCK